MSAWTDQIWPAVEKNGVARRKLQSVQEYGKSFLQNGVDELVTGAKQRKYHVVLMGNQAVIFKHPIEVKC